MSSLVFLTLLVCVQANQLDLGSFGVASSSRRLLATPQAVPVHWDSINASTGTLPPPLMYHSACILSPSGTAVGSELFLFGGMGLLDSGLSLENKLWAFSIANTAWSEIPSTGSWPHSRQQHGVASNGTHMLIHGGVANTQIRRDTWLLHGTSRSWSLVQAFSVHVRYGQASVWIGDAVYSFGGADTAPRESVDTNTPLTNNVIFLNMSLCLVNSDGTTCTAEWAVTTPVSGVLPLARFMHSATLVRGCMMVYGGEMISNSKAVALDDLWTFCPVTLEWNALANATTYFDAAANMSVGYLRPTVDHTQMPISSHQMLSVAINSSTSQTLQFSIGGALSLDQHDPPWFALPAMRTFEHFEKLRSVMGNWVAKPSVNMSTIQSCTSVQACANTATLRECQDACDLEYTCNAVEYSNVSSCCKQNCPAPSAGRMVGHDGYARIDFSGLGAFVEPTFTVGAGVQTKMYGHAAAVLGDTVYVHGGTGPASAMVSVLTSFRFNGSGCPAGTRGLPRSTNCATCAAGFFSEAGGYNCAPCAPGTFSNLPEAGACQKCPQGTYNTQYGASSIDQCVACAGGKANLVLGSTTASECVDCPAGKTSDAKAARCDLCPEGSASSVIGRPGNSGNASVSRCPLCPAGTFSSSGATNCTLCNAGMYNDVPGMRSCFPCPAGYYSGAGAANCDSCPAGFFSSLRGATSASVCQPCGKGKYSSTASSECSTCAAGKYADTSQNTHIDNCTSCFVGKISTIVGATSSDTCISCPPGTFSEASASTLCTKCPSGNYSEATGSMYASDCKSCPAGKITVGDGAASASSCVSCLTGWGQDSTGECAICTAGTHSSLSASTNSAICRRCLPGFYSALDMQETCIACSSGKFTGTGWTACSSCDATFLCNPVCSSHGACTRGTCVCEAGWGDDSCNSELCPSSGCSSSEITFEYPVFRVKESGLISASGLSPTLVRTGCCQAVTQVNVSLLSSQASVGSDYSSSFVLATFASGEAKVVLNVSALLVQDIQVESCETINLTAILPNGGNISSQLQIEDDDVGSYIKSTATKRGSPITSNLMNLYLAPQSDQNLTFTVNVSVPSPGQCVGCPTGDNFCKASFGQSSYCQTGSQTCSGTSTACSCTGCSNEVVDILLIQDLTGSYEDDLPNMKRILGELIADMTAIYPNVHFGLASFVDKGVTPFGEVGELEWKLEQPVTADSVRVNIAGRALRVKVGGDLPESQLTALMQASKQHATVGWRHGSERVAVLLTDAPYHKAGDGLNANVPITTPNNNDDMVSTNEDYPSVAGVRAALLEQNILPIFAVTADQVPRYNDLSARLGFGVTSTLAVDSSNLVTAVVQGMKSRAAEVSIVSDPASYWEEWLGHALSGTVDPHNIQCYTQSIAKSHCEAAGTRCSGITKWPPSCWRLHSSWEPLLTASYDSWLHVGCNDANCTVLYLTNGEQKKVATPGATTQFHLTLKASESPAYTLDTSFSLVVAGYGRTLVHVNRDQLTSCVNTCPASSQLPAGATVTCQVTMESEITSVFYNGQDITFELSPQAGFNDHTQAQTFSFQTVDGAVLAISGNSANSGKSGACGTAGLLMACSSSDANWNQAKTSASAAGWTSYGSASATAPTNWFLNSHTGITGTPCAGNGNVTMLTTTGSGSTPTPIWSGSTYSWFRFRPPSLAQGTQCSGHGACKVSSCACDAGWDVLPDCSVNSGVGATGIVRNGDAELGTGLLNGATGWTSVGAGYKHDRSAGFGAQVGARLELVPGGGASQTFVAGDRLPVNRIPMSVSVWAMVQGITPPVLPASMNMSFVFKDGSSSTSSIVFDAGTYGWRSFGRQFDAFNKDLQSVALLLSLPVNPAGSRDFTTYVDAVSLIPDAQLSCKCDPGFYIDSTYPGGCKRCEPGFFCGKGAFSDGSFEPCFRGQIRMRIERAFIWRIH